MLIFLYLYVKKQTNLFMGTRADLCYRIECEQYQRLLKLRVNFSLFPNE